MHSERRVVGTLLVLGRRPASTGPRRPGRFFLQVYSIVAFRCLACADTHRENIGNQPSYAPAERHLSIPGAACCRPGAEAEGREHPPGDLMRRTRTGRERRAPTGASSAGHTSGAGTRSTYVRGAAREVPLPETETAVDA